MLNLFIILLYMTAQALSRKIDYFWKDEQLLTFNLQLYSIYKQLIKDQIE
jgi:hypothetical protein